MLKLNIRVCLVVMFCKNYDQLFLEVLKSILQSNISSRKYVGFKNIICLGNVVKCNKSIYVYIVSKLDEVCRIYIDSQCNKKVFVVVI